MAPWTCLSHLRMRSPASTLHEAYQHVHQLDAKAHGPKKRQSSAEPPPTGSDLMELPNLTVPYRLVPFKLVRVCFTWMLYPKKRQGPRAT